MADDDAILGRLQVLRNELAYLKQERDAAPLLEAYSADGRLNRAVERSLHLAIEACLDIGRRVISLSGLRYPDTNQDVVKELAEAAVISPALAKQLVQMARFRNLLVHDYLAIDDSVVFDILRHHLADFDAFAMAITRWLDEGPMSAESSTPRQVE